MSTALAVSPVASDDAPSTARSSTSGLHTARSNSAEPARASGSARLLGPCDSSRARASAAESPRQDVPRRAQAASASSAAKSITAAQAWDGAPRRAALKKRPPWETA